MASFIKTHKHPYPALDAVLASKPLNGKAVLITGAGRGIGEHIAVQIAKAGASRIGLLGRDKVRIVTAKDRLSESYPNSIFQAFAADITNENAITNVFKTFGKVDVLVNNAGHFPDEGNFTDQDLQKWWQGFEINILGTAIVTQQYLLAKPQGDEGIVLNVSSMAAHIRFPMHGWAGYNASKMGQARLFEYIRFEHPDVRFISIHPGMIQSDGFVRSGASAPADGLTDGELAGQFFVWAATEEAAFLTGRFIWAEWDIEELKKKKDEIIEKDLLLTTIDGFKQGF